jgi:hypothetical protein
MIVASGSITEFFREAIEDALQSKRVSATGTITNYLVALLADFALPSDNSQLSKPLAFQLDEALNAPDPAERFEKLRTLGDNILYSCGFFADHYEARGVDQRYLYGIGTRAYGTAAGMLRGGEGDGSVAIFPELAARFGQYVDVVHDVADATATMGVHSSERLLKVYERWQRTGSERLAKELSSQGLVPARKVSGLQ